MKILTLNTHSWMEDNQDDKINCLVETILREDYDVICLQEVNQKENGQALVDDYWIDSGTDIAPAWDNFAYVLADCLRNNHVNYYWTWLPTHLSYGMMDEGIAILSQTDFQVSCRELSKDHDYLDYHRRLGLLATCQLANHVVEIYNVHLSWWNDGFQTEWGTLNDWLNHSPNDQPVQIVAGDFNQLADAVGEGYDLIENTQPHLQDTFIVAKEVSGEFTVPDEIDGWSGNPNQKRIDYIFVSKNASVLSHRVVFNGTHTPIVSDHFGVQAEIKF